MTCDGSKAMPLELPEPVLPRASVGVAAPGCNGCVGGHGGRTTLPAEGIGGGGGLLLGRHRRIDRRLVVIVGTGGERQGRDPGDGDQAKCGDRHETLRRC
jgi:hypothetical protein